MTRKRWRSNHNCMYNKSSIAHSIVFDLKNCKLQREISAYAQNNPSCVLSMVLTFYLNLVLLPARAFAAPTAHFCCTSGYLVKIAVVHQILEVFHENFIERSVICHAEVDPGKPVRLGNNQFFKDIAYIPPIREFFLKYGVC